MTKTTLNKNEIDSTFPGTQDLGSLFQNLEHAFQERGEVICQFRINGMVLTEADEQRLSLIGLDEVETVEVDSQSPEVLLFSLLENWIRELPVLMENADRLAKEIKFDGIEGHLKAFVDLLDSCHFLTESLVSLDNIIKAPIINRESWQKAEALTARAIGEALKTFEQKDFVLLSEILEYDLGNALQTWFEEIKRLNQTLKEENTRDAQRFSEKIFEKGS